MCTKWSALAEVCARSLSANSFVLFTLFCLCLFQTVICRLWPVSLTCCKRLKTMFIVCQFDFCVCVKTACCLCFSVNCCVVYILL